MITELGTWFGLITAACTMVIALASMVVMVVSRRTKKTVEATHQQTIVIHQLVNQKFTDLERWNGALQNALRRAGVEVPEDQSKLDTSGTGIA